MQIAVNEEQKVKNLSFLLASFKKNPDNQQKYLASTFFFIFGQ